MESLQYLLKHPCMVVNKISVALYEQDNAAYYARLRSRASGRHRFTEEEATSLIKIFSKLAKDLSKIAAKLSNPALTLRKTGSKNDTGLLTLLNNPMINWKPLLSKAAQQQNLPYHRLYDSLRSRSKLNPDDLQALITEIENMATEINTSVDLAKKETKKYAFSYGRGAHSHILA